MTKLTIILSLIVSQALFAGPDKAESAVRIPETAEERSSNIISVLVEAQIEAARQKELGTQESNPATVIESKKDFPLTEKINTGTGETLEAQMPFEPAIFIAAAVFSIASLMILVRIRKRRKKISTSFKKNIALLREERLSINQTNKLDLLKKKIIYNYIISRSGDKAIHSGIMKMKLNTGEISLASRINALKRESELMTK